MNNTYTHFILFNLKFFGEIVTTLMKWVKSNLFEAIK